MQATATGTLWFPEPIVLDPECRRNLASCMVDVEGALRREVLDSTQRTTLSQLRASLKRALEDADRLDRDGVSVVFIAPKGAGKSSLLSGILNLWSPPIGHPEPGEYPGDHLQRCSALPLGAGGTTPCEVQFRHAGGWSIQVEREDDATVLARVGRLAASTWQRTRPGMPADAPGLAGAPVTATIEQDVDRCLTGLCGHDPKTLADRAKALASEPLGLALLRDELIQRLNYASKTSLHIQPLKDELPVEWLRKTLLCLTWGRYPGQPFPVRIVVHGPALPRMQGSTQVLRLVDTLGLTAGAVGAQPPARAVASLDALARDPWALVLFVAAYMNPPEPVTDTLKHAFSGASPWMEADRAIVPVLYKGEAITLDPNSRESKEERRGRDAFDKQNVSVANINALLRQAKKGWNWTPCQSPVVDLLGMLGEHHGTLTLTKALDRGLQRLRFGWDARAKRAIWETRTFIRDYDTILKIGISRTDLKWLENGQIPKDARDRFREPLRVMIRAVGEWLAPPSELESLRSAMRVGHGGGVHTTRVVNITAHTDRFRLRFAVSDGRIECSVSDTLNTGEAKTITLELRTDSAYLCLSKLEFVHHWNKARYA
jgi:hypothetical protein